MSMSGLISKALCALLLSCLLFCNGAMANDHDAVYKDPSQPVQDRVDDLLKRMTLDEKLGQITQIEMTVANASVITKYKIGICAVECSVPSMLYC